MVTLTAEGEGAPADRSDTESVTQNNATAFTTTCGQTVYQQVRHDSDDCKTYVCTTTSQTDPPQLTPVH